MDQCRDPIDSSCQIPPLSKFCKNSLDFNNCLDITSVSDMCRVSHTDPLCFSLNSTNKCRTKADSYCEEIAGSKCKDSTDYNNCLDITTIVTFCKNSVD